MGRRPLLSVQLVVRDGERWLPSALRSLEAQTCRDFEVVAVDDGSRDETPRLLHAAAEVLPMVCRRTEGVGVAAARNVSLESAQAPVIAALDADDAWLPWYVERVLARLDGDQDAAIVGTEALLAIEDELTTERLYGDGHLIEWQDDDQLAHVLHMNFIATSWAVRREVFDTVGGFDETLETAEDWDLWVRALAAGFRSVHEPAPCAIYRLRSGSLTSSRARLVRGRVAVLEKAAARLPAPYAALARQQLERQRLQLRVADGKSAVERRDYARARREFLGVAASAQASVRQRIGSLVVGAWPGLGRAVLSRRAARADHDALDRARRERE